MTAIILLAVAVWVVTGTLMLATRDPVAFAHLFWGVVSIVLWPVALVAQKILNRRRARPAAS